MSYISTVRFYLLFTANGVGPQAKVLHVVKCNNHRAAYAYDCLYVSLFEVRSDAVGFAKQEGLASTTVYFPGVLAFMVMP